MASGEFVKNIETAINQAHQALYYHITRMFEVYYRVPPDPKKEKELTVQISKFGGHLTFREDADGDGSTSVCLTYEFNDLSLAETAAKSLRLQGEHVEGPVDYGP